MMINCPNCGKRTFDDYQCCYCKYILKKKENNFNPVIYRYLYDDYVHSDNKAVTIKNGIAKFNRPMSEIKDIVDFIADEIYEKNNYRKKEEVNINNIHFNTYHFSFLAYFLHCAIYKFVFITGAILIPLFFKEVDFMKNNPGVWIIWYGAVLLSVLYLIYDWLKVSTTFIDVDFEEIRYRYQVINKFAIHNCNDFGRLAWASYIKYEIKKITNIKENPNSFIIYGDIVRTQCSERLGGSIDKNESQIYKKIKIRKCFKQNNKLIDELKNRIKT